MTFYGPKFTFLVDQANFLLGYEIITMIIVLVTIKEKLLDTDFNQDNWMLELSYWELINAKRFAMSFIYFKFEFTNFLRYIITFDRVEKHHSELPLWLNQLSSYRGCTNLLQTSGLFQLPSPLYILGYFLSENDKFGPINQFCLINVKICHKNGTKF